MTKLSLLAAGAVFALTTATAQAAVTLDFPGAGTEWLSQGNEDSGVLVGGDETNFMWITDDYVRQSFANTGLASATSADGIFRIENVLGDMDLLVDVVLNGITVGQFTIEACNFCSEIQDRSFSFDFAPIAGDDFDVEYRLANSIAGGNGSVRWFDEGSELTLDGAEVPEPATLALMIAGLGVVASMRRLRAVPQAA